MIATVRYTELSPTRFKNNLCARDALEAASLRLRYF